jgi:predicted signal transduction protein with EAL and GGDEF domain
LPTETPPLMSRLGGDEFFVSFIAQTSAAVSVTETFGATLIGRLKDPVPIALENGDERCIVGVSMGFVTLAAQGALIDTVLADADIALYSSKRAGKGRMTRFQPEMREAAVSRLHRETELRRGLLDGEFEPFFQPQVDMATGRFRGFEALARWRHPVHGLLGPAAFLPDAEDTNMVNAIEGRDLQDDRCPRADERRWAECADGVDQRVGAFPARRWICRKPGRHLRDARSVTAVSGHGGNPRNAHHGRAEGAAACRPS